jgi:polyferredoxin
MVATMIHLRRIVQILTLGFFLYLIIRPAEPLNSVIPATLFFITDPLIALVNSIASKTLVFTLLASLVVVVLTVLLGRVFCGWVCPLGTTFDIFDRVFLRKFKRWSASIKWRRVKFLLLFVIIVTAFFGVSLVGWFDPITLIFKFYALVVYPAWDWFAKTALDAIGLRHRASDLVNTGLLASRALFFQYSILFLVIMLVIFLLNLFQPRFWCRNLCPLGALLGLCSRWRFLKVMTGTDCTECQQCRAVCKMGARGEDLVVRAEECIHCYRCVKACPTENMQIKFKTSAVHPPGNLAGRPPTVSILPERRGFLLSLGAGIIGGLLLKKTIIRDRASLPVLRPPGADRSEEQFLAKCIRCGACMKVCPYNALQPFLWEGGFYGMWSPVLVPRIGYCGYECNLCGNVCPTGAIPNLSLEEKQKWKIGTARTYHELCTRCLACEENCPIPSKAIMIDNDRYPQVIGDICIGCGTCENVCPVPAKAIRVYPDPALAGKRVGRAIPK